MIRASTGCTVDLVDPSHGITHSHHHHLSRPWGKKKMPPRSVREPASPPPRQKQPEFPAEILEDAKGIDGIIPNNSGRSTRSNRKIPVTRTSRYQLPPETLPRRSRSSSVCRFRDSFLSRKRRYGKEEVVTLLASSAKANIIYHDWCEYHRWECCMRLVIASFTANRGGPLVCSLRCRAQ